MPTFYRVHSRMPINKPSMTIGAAVPSTGGYTTTFTPFTRSEVKAERECRQLRKSKPFGEHSVQTWVFEAGMQIETDEGVIVTED